MPYNGAMNLFIGDIYPDYSLITTRHQTVAEPEDQVALVDDQKLAEEHQPRMNPAVSKNIFVAAIGVLVLIVLLNIKI